MSAKVRTITPSPSSREPVRRYVAGCLDCDWWGYRFRLFQRAVNQMERHNLAAHHSADPSSGGVS